MSDSKWELIKKLFAEAAELPADAREDFLRSSVNGDDSLIAEVRSLLASADETGNIIESNALDLEAGLRTGTANFEGQTFGNYRIIREIGSGGMGSVFLAERIDGQLEMQAALKIVRQSIAGSEVVSQFRRERQILADLHHPNIAMLLDGGVSGRGEPYLAMEYIDGRPLTEFAAAEKLTVDERLRLFLKVCSAVAFAHRNLIVHRDIKPSNILVTADGEPKLLDFGLAKAFEMDASATQTGFRAFTPSYASPEQFLGRNVTTLSDVYSLGVVLYELLTGRKPFSFEGRSLDEMIRTITDSDPPRPSETARVAADTSGLSLDRDLDNIVLKALQKEPLMRYGSVEDLARDIERYLAGEPVTARPNTFTYRAGKFIRRNRVAVAAAGVVLLSLIAGLAATAWQFNETRKERDRAEARFNDLRQLSNSLLFEIAPKIERLQGSLAARELMLRRAVEYLDNLAAEAQNDLLLQAELAAAYEKVGDLQGNPANPNFVMLNDAVASYEKALRIRLDLDAAGVNDADSRRKLAATHRALGRVLGEANDYVAEQEHLQRAIEILSGLRTQRPEDADLSVALAQLNFDAGVGQTSLSSYGNAIPLYDNAIAILTDVPASPARDRLLASCYAQRAYSLSWESRQPEAEAEMQKAIDIAEKNGEANTDAIENRWLIYWLAGNINEEINNDKFYAFQKKAEEIARRSSESDPSDLRARQRLAKTLSHLGQAANDIGRTDEALRHLEESSRIYRGIIETETRNGRLRADLAASLTRLGEARKNRGDTAAALNSFNEAVEMYTAVAAEYPRDKRTRNNLATVYSEIAKIRERSPAEKASALAGYRKALSLMEEMESQKVVLSDYDRKFLEEMRLAVRRLS
ncbi:MAG: serine/threonine protein kinase [Acidobacteria bacterium]|nr:serine/threonine protein kinase [Acidobacteriota bacterium]